MYGVRNGRTGQQVSSRAHDTRHVAGNADGGMISVQKIERVGA